VFLSLRTHFLLPGTMERRAQVQLHAHRFARFHEAYLSWQESLNEGQIAPIVEQISSVVSSRKKYDGEEAQSRIKTLKDLLLGECGRGESFLSAFLEATRQASVQLDGLLNRSASIPIVTVHQTKGCEYETVYLFQAEDDFFPNRISELGGQLEEEKRLFYVALTRAKKRLVITYSAYRLTGGQAVSVRRSRFLDLIPEEYRLECDLSGETD
ncbi:MAG: 3'-5' exonuclease, partial [Christensenellaceae bacterium]